MRLVALKQQLGSNPFRVTEALGHKFPASSHDDDELDREVPRACLK
jgi:hypothetical protein